MRKGRQIKCATCGRDADSSSKHELEHLGWLLMGNTALCTTCVADGWRLTPRTRLPYRLTEQEREG